MYGFAALPVFMGSPLGRVLTVCGFAVLGLAAGVLALSEVRWELLTAGLLGLLAYNIAYPVPSWLSSRGCSTNDTGEGRDGDQLTSRRAGHHGATRRRTRAAQLDGLRRECIANVSHELRAPLTVLTGYLETVRELELGPEESRDYLGRMDVQCRRMRGIIEDLLQYSTLEAAAAPARSERVDIGEVLACVRSEAEALSAGRHCILLEADDGVELLGAQSEITSAFCNLARNAVRYTPPGGLVRLIWRAAAAGAEFAVEDTGVGIEKEHLPRLTERFYRVDPDRPGGTGLGLAIVKQALIRHQAELSIESEPARGSRFTARFPAHRVIAARQTARHRDPGAPTRSVLAPRAELEAATTLQ